MESGWEDAVQPWASLYLPRAFTTRFHVVTTCEMQAFGKHMEEHQESTWEAGSCSFICLSSSEFPQDPEDLNLGVIFLHPYLSSLGTFTSANPQPATGHHLDSQLDWDSLRSLLFSPGQSKSSWKSSCDPQWNRDKSGCRLWQCPWQFFCTPGPWPEDGHHAKVTPDRPCRRSPQYSDFRQREMATKTNTR